VASVERPNKFVEMRRSEGAERETHGATGDEADTGVGGLFMLLATQVKNGISAGTYTYPDLASAAAPTGLSLLGGLSLSVPDEGPDAEVRIRRCEAQQGTLGLQRGQDLRGRCLGIGRSGERSLLLLRVPSC